MRFFTRSSEIPRTDTSIENIPAPDYRFHSGSVARNTVLIFGAQVFTRILALISSIILANYFDIQYFGIYNYAIAFTTLFTPLCDFGMDTYLLQRISRGAEKAITPIVESVISGKIILTFVDYMVLVVIAALAEPFLSANYIFILLAGGVVFSRSYWNTFSFFFRSINRVQYDVSILSIIRIAELGIVIATIILRKDLIFLFGGLAVINLLGVTVTFFIAHRYFVKFRIIFNFPRIWQTMKGGVPYALTAVFVTIYFNIDTILVKFFVNESAAGLYRASYNLIIPMMIVTVSFTGALFPYISQNFDTQRDKVRNVIRTSASYLLMIALPCTAVGVYLADEIILLLYSPSYAGASTSMMILAWFLPVVFLTNLYGNALGAIGNQMYVLKVTIINALFNITANIILIPIFAQNGAAAVTVMTELLGLSILTIYTQKIFGPIISFGSLFRIVLACGVMLIYLVIGPKLPLLPTFAIAGIIYTASLFALRAISVQEFKLLFTAIQRGKLNS